MFWWFKNNFNFTKWNVAIDAFLHVLKQREVIPRYGNSINNSFLGAVCSNTFYENYLFKNTLMHLSTYALIHEEVNYLKDVLKKNSIPTNLVDKCKKIF